MKDEIIDLRIVPGVLITLSQRMKYIPYSTRSVPGFDIQNTNVPVWRASTKAPASPYERVPSGSIAHIIRRYVERDVTRFEVLLSGGVYQCYGVHADLLVQKEPAQPPNQHGIIALPTKETRWNSHNAS